MYLDSKRTQHQNGSVGTDDEKNVGKNLSGFANAEGGVLLWGVEKKDHRAAELKPIPNVRMFAERLSSLSPTFTERPVPGVMHEVAEQEDGSGYCMTYIRESDFKPHMCTRDHVYYYRFTDNTKEIGHSMVEALMFAKRRPQLRLSPTSSIIGNKQVFSILVANMGHTIASSVALTVDRAPECTPTAGNFVTNQTVISDGVNGGRYAELFRLVNGGLIYPQNVHEVAQLQVPTSSSVNIRCIIHADGFRQGYVLHVMEDTHWLLEEE